MRRRQGLKVFDVRLQVTVENHAWVEQPPGIKERLDRLHQGKGCLAPFLFDKGGHVPACPVFCLERAIVFFQHQLDHIGHEITVAHHFGFGGEILGKDEVQIAGQGVTEDDGLVIVVLQQQFLEIQGGVGQVLDRKGHVFYDNSGTGLSDRTDRREQSLADLPQLGELLGHGGELDRPHRVQVLQAFLDPGNLGLQIVCRLSPGLYQKSGHPGGQAFEKIRHARFAGHRGQAGSIHQFSCGHR